MFSENKPIKSEISNKILMRKFSILNVSRRIENYSTAQMAVLKYF